MHPALGLPGKVTVAGREFTIPQPTAADHARVHERMREIASAGCVHPLLSVNAIADKLSPAVLAEATRAAVTVGSGGGSEPTREAVLRAYGSLEGVRFQLWYLARKAQPNLTREDVAALVTEENRYDVADALAAATNPPGGRPDDPKAPSPGASG